MNSKNIAERIAADIPTIRDMRKRIVAIHEEQSMSRDQRTKLFNVDDALWRAEYLMLDAIEILDKGTAARTREMFWNSEPESDG